MPRRLLLVLAGLGLLALARPAAAYSVLTHQANVDSCWVPCFVPALSARYPNATPAELKEAKAYAYGGAIVQDMGYYPFGSHLFTNLTHYVRSGDFVRNLLLEAQNRNQYAFALGAMAHYAADLKGHGLGTNKALPEMFPELKAKYGNTVTYEQAPLEHKQAEFGFDVVQMAAGRYRTDAYHDFIGFKVEKDVLERAFLKTYGLALGAVTVNVDLSIASFRFSVRQLIPVVARAAWRTNRHEIRRVTPGARRREYTYKQSKSQYHKEYGSGYEQPGFGARLLSAFIGILPKVGPLRALKVAVPSAQAQATYRASFRQTVREYCSLLNEQQKSRAALPNIDFDTGKETHLGEYPLADETYGEWLRKLAKDDFKALSPPMKQHILSFFANPGKAPADADEKEKDKRKETLEALAKLRAL